MSLTPLDAISPIDGRYRKVCEPLAGYFSESALIRYRVQVEAAYLLALAETGLAGPNTLSAEAKNALQRMASSTNEIHAARVKEIESTTNHDVKAVEYYMKEQLGDLLGGASEFIHFGLTSQDINNTAIPMLLRDALQQIMAPALDEVLQKLCTSAESWRNMAMLSRTHGQPASPTTLGKEFAVFCERIIHQKKLLQTIPWSAKFGGATGNFNAHHAAYPDYDWASFGNRFIQSLGLHRSSITTQIEHYDNMAAVYDNWRRINTILIDLSRDVWTYVSMGYFTQSVKKGEVGSSAMPHKVNPIDFENAEGNLGMANAVFQFLSEKLPVSRLQRDLTDSTVLRNAGVPFAHTLIALRSLSKGLDKIQVNPQALANDLEANWAVVSEAVQTILRREGYPQPYEALKELTRNGGDSITRDTMHAFINSLAVSDAVKHELLAITPVNFTGNASRFVIPS
ncbi:MAG: adenylosuccinate lyase [Bacteroidota bacterium]